jgi:hypothetical protein
MIIWGRARITSRFRKIQLGGLHHGYFIEATKTPATLFCRARLNAVHRIALLDIVITSTANSGAGTLRQAMLDANTDGVVNTIIFDLAVFPSASPASINLTTALPVMSGAGDTIDAAGGK